MRIHLAQQSRADGMVDKTVHRKGTMPCTATSVTPSAAAYTQHPLSRIDSVETGGIHSVAVKINQEDPQTAWVTITDRTDNSEPTDHLFSYSWPDRLFVDSLADAMIYAYLHKITGDEHVARTLAPHLGRARPGQVGD